MAKAVSNISPEMIAQFFSGIRAGKTAEILARLAHLAGILDIAVDADGNNALHLCTK